MISDYEILSLEGMNLDSVSWSGSVLRAEYGDGYGDSAVVGNPNGLHSWTLSAGALPDNADYGGLIEGVPRFQYYWDFMKRHTTGDTDIFIVIFRGQKYFASFTETQIDAEIFTSDLYAGGVTIRQRRVRGVFEGGGGIFDPSAVPGLWGWYDGDSFEYFGENVIDKSGNDNTLVIHGDVTGGIDGNGRSFARFNIDSTDSEPDIPSTAGWLNTTADPVIYDAFFRIKMRGATFAGYQGILSASATTAALVGNTGDTKLVDLSFGSSYAYRLNGTLYAENAQAAPMNAWGVIHAKWTNGITMTNLQIGRDRDFGDRYLLADISDIVLFNSAVSPSNGTLMTEYLMSF